jgi:lysophospholipase L1-like esterase
MRSIRARLIAVLASALVSVGLGVGPAHAETVDYVALGDSFSSGTGAPGGTGECFRSPLGYPTLWAQAHDVTFTDATCGGAVTADVLAKQVSALSADTDVVTITIGGNDVGFAQIVFTCLLSGDQACSEAIDSTLAKEDEFTAQLDRTYAAIRAGAPNAEVYVLGYPLLFDEAPVCDASLNLTQRKAVNAGNERLDDSIGERAVAAGFHFVDVRDAFAGHGACSADPWLNNLTGPDVFLHPTADGYRKGYLAALTAVTG